MMDSIEVAQMYLVTYLERAMKLNPESLRKYFPDVSSAILREAAQDLGRISEYMIHKVSR